MRQDNVPLKCDRIASSKTSP